MRATMVEEKKMEEKEFSESYDVTTEINKGAFASVHKCVHKENSKEFAIKKLRKRLLDNRELIGLQNEIKILKRVSHKNIIKLIDLFDTEDLVFIVLELCDGNNLSEEIIAAKPGHITEIKAAQIIYAISDALQYLHENGVVHRDLKPENILFTKDGILKITDFGLAHCQILSSNDKNNGKLQSLYRMKTMCGSPYYVAPEIIKEYRYNYKCDIWSLGVILYIVLSGYQPFYASKLNQIYGLIASGDYNLKAKEWNDISNEAKDLIKHLLKVDAKKRYSTNDIKCHPWIQKHIK